MPTFKYVAKDENARNITGTITAETQGSVVSELRKRNLVIVSINAAKDKSGSKLFSFSEKKVKEEDLVVFTRQLGTMVDAGVPIIQALDSLADQMVGNQLNRIILLIKEDIRLGNSLSAAFSKHSKIFDSLYVNMIRVGEKGGVLSAVLERISEYLEKSMKLRRKVKAALIYPCVVITMAVAITIVLLVKVVPTFSEIYASFNRDLPAMTQVLLTVSRMVTSQLVYWLIGFTIFVFLLIRWYHTDRGALVIDRIKLKIPLFGPMIHKVVLSRFSRTLATLTTSGVAILEALDIVGKSCGNKVVEGVVAQVKENVREGESIANPLTKSGLFPTMVTRMISVGEQTGQLEKMLHKIAEFYDDQVDTAVAGLTSIIEPVLISFLGIVVGFIVIALFLPIISVTQVLQ